MMQVGSISATIDSRNTLKPYMTIRDCAGATGIAQYALRKLLKDGKLPGFYVGNRYMVDVDGLRDAIRNSEI